MFLIILLLDNSIKNDQSFIKIITNVIKRITNVIKK